MLEKFKNADVFLRLGQHVPSTLIRHKNGALRKRPSNRRNLKTSKGFSFWSVWLENISFSKTIASCWSRDFPARVFLNQIQNGGRLFHFQIPPAQFGRRLYVLTSQNMNLSWMSQSLPWQGSYLGCVEILLLFQFLSEFFSLGCKLLCFVAF